MQKRNVLVPIPTEKVAYFLKDEIIFLYTFDGERYVCDFNTMDEIIDLLDPALFYRANRQHIIHIEAVESVKNTHKGLTIHLKKPLDANIDISREKASDFKNWLS